MDHPNIPKYYNCFVYENNLYIISEYIKSSTNLIKELGKQVFFTEDKAKEVINQVNSILKYCMKKLPGSYLNINLESINYADNDNKIFVINYSYIT